jgi:hypothetical protein
MQDLSPRDFSPARDAKEDLLFVRDEFLMRVNSASDLENISQWSADQSLKKIDAFGIYKIHVPAGTDVPVLAAMINAWPGDIQAEPDFACHVAPPYRRALSLPDGEIAKTFRGDGKFPLAVLDAGPGTGRGPNIVATRDDPSCFPMASCSHHIQELLESNYQGGAMKKAELTLPEIALIAGTRGMLGAGAGLLLAERLNDDQRKAIGWTLLIIGTISTIPLALEVLSKRQ